MCRVAVLWDESYLWGVLVWHALRSFEIPRCVIRSYEIAQGCLLGKRPTVVIAPGGGARRKAASLGLAGMKALRGYVSDGGTYIGFCGGAGLALAGRDGLGLCPWRRAAVRQRLLHLVNGHMQVGPLVEHCLVPAAFGKGPVLVPVWWPSRFGVECGEGVTVLAAYGAPGSDFWVADMPLTNLSQSIFYGLGNAYSVQLQLGSLAGQPCIVHGAFGRGMYLLSYAHLETPVSPDANVWFLHVLFTLLGREYGNGATLVPVWNPAGEAVRWEHPALEAAHIVLEELLSLGREHFLLFARNSWLTGWRVGIPGSHLNHLYALVCQARALSPTVAATAFLAARQEVFLNTLAVFRREAVEYFLAERPATTVSSALSTTVSRDGLRRQRMAIFGHPMEQSGLFAVLLSVLNEVVWLLFRGVDETDGSVPR